MKTLFAGVIAAVVWVVRAGSQDLPASTPPEELRPLGKVILVVPEKTNTTALTAWKRLGGELGRRVELPVRVMAVTSSAEAAGLLAKGRCDFVVLEPEDYARVAEETEQGATVALADADGNFGFQVAMLVRPESEFVTDTDVLFSELGIGLLRLQGFRGRFYRGPITDDHWRVHEDIRPRLVFGRSAEQLVGRLKRQSGELKLGAVLLPLGALAELDEDGLRNGLREVWLSPFCPGRVIAGRARLGKRERLRMGAALIAAAKIQALKAAGVGDLRMIKDSAFVPLLEFLPETRKRSQSR